MKKLLLSACLLGCLASARADVYEYTTSLLGTSEVPANGSPGTGIADVTFDSSANTLLVNFSFSGLLGSTTAAHIHAPTTVAGTGNAGVATTTPYFPGFPVGVTSGNYSHLMDLTLASSYNASFIIANGGTTTGAEAALFADLNDGKAYLNIHTTLFPGGEIRGNLSPVPEPTSLAMIGVGAIGLAAFRRHQKRNAQA